MTSTTSLPTASLKTLEEPPPRSLLILIGSNPERQLSTIVSRCQVVRLRARWPADLMSRLARGGHEISDPAVCDETPAAGGGQSGHGAGAETIQRCGRFAPLSCAGSPSP